MYGDGLYLNNDTKSNCVAQCTHKHTCIITRFTLHSTCIQRCVVYLCVFTRSRYIIAHYLDQFSFTGVLEGA